MRDQVGYDPGKLFHRKAEGEWEEGVPCSGNQGGKSLLAFLSKVDQKDNGRKWNPARVGRNQQT